MVKKGTKKKGTVKKKTVPMEPFNFEPVVLPDLIPEYVRCRICNTALPHLNFEWPAVPTEITIAVIKAAISARHGGTAPDLVLWRGAVTPDTCLGEHDDGTSLRQLGVRGLTTGAPEALPTVTLHYDFKPARHDDAIASVESQARASKVDLKAYLRAQRARPLLP